MKGPVSLSPDQAAFLQGPVSINLAASGPDGWPCVARAQGCAVARDRRALTVLVAASSARAVLDALDAGSALAVVFARPLTHVTLQLKATHATRVPVTPALRTCNGRYAAAFGAELGSLGYSDSMVQGLVRMLTAPDMVGLRLAPEAIYDQTPGPNAGRRVEPA